MITKVISGGQTGVDQAGWRAAKRFGIPTGGWMPLGFLTEAGLHPEFADLYGARETTTPQYPPRTVMNVRASDGTLWFGRLDSAGFRCTLNAALNSINNHQFLEVTENAETISHWIIQYNIHILNIAGNRESRSRGFGHHVEQYLCELFQILGFKEV